LVEGDENHLEVIVDEDQLSLAIGKRGQNVRLAGKLLDIKIDIKSEDDKRQEVEKTLARMALRELEVAGLAGVGPQMADALTESGIGTVGEVADAGVERLVEVPGIGPKTAGKIHSAALEALEAEIEDEVSEEEVLPTLESEGTASGDAGTNEDDAASAVLASLVMDSAEAEADAAESNEPETSQD
jgi:N utilization substance protein A